MSGIATTAATLDGNPIPTDKLTLNLPRDQHTLVLMATDHAGNSARQEYQFTILVGPPTDKEQCKQDGWKSFNNPVFKNQGDCVSSVASNKR